MSTPLQAYLEQRDANQRTSMGNLQQAGALQTLLSHAGAQEREAKARAIIASNATPEEKFNALSQVSPAHAHQFATGLKEMQAVKSQQALQGMDLNKLLDDPQAALAAQTANPHIGPELERLRKVRENNAARATMQSRPEIPPDPQEVAQASDQGTPPVATAPAQPGIFDALAKSEIPTIANQAKTLQARLNAPGNAAVPASHWVDLQKALATQETSILERRSASEAARANRPQEPLVAVMKNGKPVMLPRSEAIGLPPANIPDASAMLDKDALEVAGWEKLLFGTDAKGFGKANTEQRKQISEERTRLGKGLGLSPMEIAMMPQDNKVKMKAVDALTKWGAFVDKGADQLVPSIDLAISYAQKMDPTKLQTLNKAIIAGRTEFNDPTANAYAVAVNTVRREYGRLMSGPTSNAMLPVEAMKQSDHLISTALDVPGWNEVKNVILQDAGFTKAAVKKQIDSLRTSMLPLGAAPAAAPAPAAPTAPAAPSGWSIKPVGG